MSSFFKFFLLALVSILIGLYLFITTTAGKEYLRDIASERLSQKSGLEVEVESISLDQYPVILAKLNIEKKAKLTLTGFLTNSSLDMDYHLISGCIHLCCVCRLVFLLWVGVERCRSCFPCVAP